MPARRCCVFSCGVKPNKLFPVAPEIEARQIGAVKVAAVEHQRGRGLGEQFGQARSMLAADIVMAGDGMGVNDLRDGKMLVRKVQRRQARCGPGATDDIPAVQ
jgi:hypothetical protein